MVEDLAEKVRQESMAQEGRHDPVPLPKLKPGETFKFSGPITVSGPDKNDVVTASIGAPSIVVPIDFSNPDHVTFVVPEKKGDGNNNE